MPFSTTAFLTLSLLCTSLLHADIPAQADAEFMRMLQAKAAQNRMENEFKNPKQPEVQKGRATWGKSGAPILVVAYSDFQCPYCKAGAERIEDLKKKYGDKLRFMFKHLPLPFHALALPAAKRFEAINLQGSKKAFAFHDAVFKEQNRLGSEGEAFLDEVAQKAGVNVAKMKKDMESEKVKLILEADKAEATKYDINGTPGFIVGGVTVSGAQPIEAFAQIIDQRLLQIATAKRAVSSK